MLDLFLEKFLFYIYLVIPFVFAVFLGILTFLKNPIYIRRISKTFFFIQFILAFLLLIKENNNSFSFFNFNFIFDEIASIFTFLTAFLFFIFSIISKTFIKKSCRLFYCSLSTILGLTNLIILSDNICLTLGGIFWVFLISYLLKKNYRYNNKNLLLNQLKADILILLSCCVLIFYDFARLFILNEIPFNFTNLTQNLYHINNSSILYAFIGFFIIICRLFNLAPFNEKIEKSSSNNHISTINILTFNIIANALLIKIYFVFDYLFYDYEDFIAAYLILNLVWFAIISLKQRTLINYAFSSFLVFITTNIFTLFSFEDEGVLAFLYGAIAIILSYTLVFLTLNLISYKFKTNEIAQLPKISSKNKLIKFFSIFAIMNIAKVPTLALFSATLINFIIIFSIDYDGTVLNFAPYICVITCFIITLSALNMFYRILIEPQKSYKNETELSNHQIITLIVLSAAIILAGIFPQSFFNGGL